MKPAFPLYHWSPASRRKQINRYGLRPGSRSVCQQWKPPYICFSDSPSLAWVLSRTHAQPGEEWDLWMIWNNVAKGYEKLKCGDNPSGAWPTEYRVYERIWKRDVWYVGSRKSK